MGFTEAIKSGFGNYTNFSGRARRSAYWYWLLFALLMSIAANIIDAVVGTAPVLSLLVALGLLLPGLAVSVRRLHDTGRSGWWILIGLVPLIGFIVLIVFYVQDSEPTENQYGPPPKALPGGMPRTPGV
jgi:uncharacterized membrane protein YhaH (DUF805 family)